MAEIIIIAAIADNFVIGKDNKIPWYIKEDFAHFKRLTLGHPCIMGDKTYESLPKKPLPDRENIVLTLDKGYYPVGCTVFNDFEEALKYVEDQKKAFICGGATIYKLALDVADTLELTRVHMKPKGDTFFPKFDLSKWKLVKKEKHKGYTFETYKKKPKD